MRDSKVADVSSFSHCSSRVSEAIEYINIPFTVIKPKTDPERRGKYRINPANSRFLAELGERQRYERHENVPLVTAI